MPIEIESLDGEKPLAGSIPVWQYMGLEKFLDLITNNRMRFVRASLLSDKRELSLPLDQLEANYYRHLAKTDLNLDQPDPEFQKVREMRNRVSALKDRVYLNCWAIGQHESYALWKIYLGGSKAGVAIKSSLAALKKSFTGPKDGRIHLARVKYTDSLEIDGISDTCFITNKSGHYEYEKELRLFAFDEERNSNNINWQLLPNRSANTMVFQISPEILINEIYLSPFVIGGFRHTIEQVVKRINPKIIAKIRTSSVRDC